MTFRAILDDGKEHKPVLLMMTGQMTPRQIDKEYARSIGRCPDCEGYLRQTDTADGSLFAAAVAGKDPRVSYRRGHYMPGTDELLRQMCFKHAAGWRMSGLTPCSCRSRNQLLHIEAVEAIAHQYRQDMPKGYKVEAECQFVKPGTPPETYRPDIVVFNQFGGRHTCIEYQRSPERFESFVHRHELRGSEWGNVIWFFDQKIWRYRSTCEARDWLFDNGQTFYQCWVDESTLQLQVEEGTFATAVVKEAERKRLPKPFVPKHCSTADIINAYMAATGQETSGKGDRVRNRPEPPNADRLQGFNLVEKSEDDRRKNRELFESLKRQQQERAEEERRQRERQAKQRLMDQIRWAYGKVRIVNPAPLEAKIEWSVNALQKYLDRMEMLIPSAERREREIEDERNRIRRRQEQITFLVSRGYDYNQLDEYSDDLLAEITRQHQEEEAKIARQIQEAEAKAAEEAAAARAEMERSWQAEEQARREAEQAEYLRQQAETERRRQLELKAWQPVQVVPASRGKSMVIGLFIGDLIRRGPGHKPENYRGRSGAGYSTDTATYRSLDGWQKFHQPKEQMN